MPGSRYRGRFLSLIVSRDNPGPHAQAAVLVTKKHSLKASGRNLLRRRLLELLFPYLENLPPAKLLLLPYPQAAAASYHDLAKDLEQLIQPLIKATSND